MNRNTPQRSAIEDVLRKAIGPLSAQEILLEASTERQRIGIATVYRHLKALQSEHAIRVLAMPDGTSRYERADLGHHHHFLCSACQRVYDVPAQQLSAGGLPRGFAKDHDEVVIVGRCPSCPAPPPARAAAFR